MKLLLRRSALRFVNQSHQRCRGGESSHPGPGQSLEPVWGPSGEESRASWASLLAPRQSTDGTFSPLELLVLSTTLMDGVRRIFQFFQGWRKRACWVSTGYASARSFVAMSSVSFQPSCFSDFSLVLSHSGATLMQQFQIRRQRKLLAQMDGTRFSHRAIVHCQRAISVVRVFESQCARQGHTSDSQPPFRQQTVRRSRQVLRVA